MSIRQLLYSNKLSKDKIKLKIEGFGRTLSSNVVIKSYPNVLTQPLPSKQNEQIVANPCSPVLKTIMPVTFWYSELFTLHFRFGCQKFQNASKVLACFETTNVQIHFANGPLTIH